MNRLSPLIVRHYGPLAPVLALPAPALDETPFPASAWLEDLRQFLTGWAGGMIFFLTFLS